MTDCDAETPIWFGAWESLLLRLCLHVHFTEWANRTFSQELQIREAHNLCNMCIILIINVICDRIGVLVSLYFRRAPNCHKRDLVIVGYQDLPGYPLCISIPFSGRSFNSGNFQK